MSALLQRQTFQTSRLLEYFSEKELTLQTGHAPNRWLEVILKELIDNSLDASEDAGTLPEIGITVTPDLTIVEDDGPGLPASVVDRILDFSIRVSSKDAYISPTRGAQGNALKTVLAIPFVQRGGQACTVTIESQGLSHRITITLDRIEQAPTIHHQVEDSSVKTGTRVTVPIGCLESAFRDCVLPLVESYSLFNPAATFTLYGPAPADSPTQTIDGPLGKVSISPGSAHRFERTTRTCDKWKSSDPTSAHWYTPAQLRALMAAYVSAERRGGQALTVRDFIGQFKGLSSTLKRKAILAQLPTLAGCTLNACVTNGDIDAGVVSALLDAMRQESKPVNPLDLGVLGQPHLQTWLAAHGGVQATIQYRRIADVDEDTGLPFVFEFAFGARQDDGARRVLVGINSAPTLVDPFRALKGYGIGLDGLLTEQYIGPHKPVTCVVHLSCPHLHYTDRGKSSLEAL